jgi:tRNA pseudouridine55 synthase
LLDKPEGLASFGAVRRARRALGVRKIGHLGTLDPFATGLLPLLVGEATKLAPFLLPEPKTYRAVVRLGEATDTQDLTGRVVARSDFLPAPEQVLAAAAALVGEIEQVPPMFSALRHQGRRLYELARQGEEAPRRPRRVTVYRLEVEEVALPRATFTVTCSQGTYIRTLAADLGEALNCGGHLIALRRLAVGHLRVDEALPLDEMDNLSRDELLARLVPLAQCLPGLPAAMVGAEAAHRLRQGRRIETPINGLGLGDLVRALCGDELVAVAKVQGQAPDLMLAPVRVFVPEDGA